MDLVHSKTESMSTFRFHFWTVVEIETDDGIIGLGNVALAPAIAKAIIDQYLTPLVLGQDPWDYEYLWQRMYRATHAWGRKGVTVQGGLPLPITTPAHGTAYDIAGNGVADVNATLNAFRIACRLGAARLHS